MNETDTYILGRSDRETRRLILQHQVYGPITRRFFQAAGIGTGMKVLDLGSGAGDVAMLVAEMVGPAGQVIGVDMNAEILETARARAQAAGWTNVTFQAGDVREIALDSDFDAVVGRWVLMYMPEPAQLLRQVATRLKPGGIVAFHENDFTYPPTTFPLTTLSEELLKWGVPPVDDAMRRWTSTAPFQGAESQMGTKLFRAYVQAGLPGPQLIVEAAAGGGPNWPGYELFAETMRSLLPMLEKTGRVNAKAVDLDTLAERMRKTVTENHGLQMMPLMFGAWSRRA